MACGVSPQATTGESARRMAAMPATAMDDGPIGPDAVDAGAQDGASASGDDGATASDSEHVSPALDSGLSSDASLPDPAALAASNTAFALDLYHALTGGDPTPNLAFAPYSVSVALAMAYSGAAGRTAAQMASALHFDLPGPRLHAAFKTTDLALASRGADAGAITLNVADSLWVDQSLPLMQPFVDTLSNDYGSPAQPVDFASSPDMARLAINQWVSGATSGNISDLFPAGSITPQTRVVLANAIYLDARWLVLPATGQFGAFEPTLSGGFFEQLTASLGPANVVLTLPKFALTGASTSLRAALTSLGMIDAFQAGADFSAMTSGNLRLEDVIQQTMVSIDEMGTKAAAATGATLGWYGAASYPDMVYVTINRPFFFIIRDIPTNTVLFVGRVTDPTQ